ncbi:MAG: ABC transporter permease [bacterium]
MPELIRDLRYAARTLGKSPGFAAVAVITLALGIGANTAVFSLVNAVLLRPLPYDDPEKLVLVWESAPFFGVKDSPVAPANYFDWKARSRSFEEMGALEDRSYRLTGEGLPELVEGAVVTPEVFRALRTRPALGRIFRDDENRVGAPKVAIISDSFWRRRYGADPGVIGRTITLNDEKHTIVGVLAPGTEPPSEYRSRMGEVWTPLASAYTEEGLRARGRHNWMVIARGKPGVALAQANAEMQAIGASLAREYPNTNEKVGAFVAPMREHFVSSNRRVLFMLLGTAALVLLIACSNLANLLLSRAANRGREVAVRAALGAGTRHLARQFLCESLLVCAAGSVLGVALATASFRFLAHLAPGAMAGFKALSLDVRVMLFALAIAALTTIAFGLAPLLELRRLDVNSSLKQGGRTQTVSGSRRLRAALICSEVALAFVLLTGAGLLIRTCAELRAVDVGCRTENLLTLRLSIPQTHSGNSQKVAYEREILRRISTIPGVISAGVANHVPLAVKGDITGIGAEGRDPRERFQCRSRTATPGYFSTMGIPLLSGRDISERDVEGAPLVAVINDTLAKMLWPGQNPIGRHLVFSSSTQAEVVGVIGDVRQSGLDVPPQPEFYTSAWQMLFSQVAIAVHTRVAPESVAGAVRQAIWAVDPDQPITDMATMEEIVDSEVFSRRMQMILLAAFASLALVLAAVGLYGVLAYQVNRQVPEIGLRMALGATPGEVLRRIVGRGVGLAAIGAVVGLAGAMAMARFVESLLFGVKPTDPATYAVTAAVLLATAAAASYLPARRATRVDPIVALRAE